MSPNNIKVRLCGTQEFIDQFLKYARTKTAQELYEQGCQMLAVNDLDGCTVLQYAAQIGQPDACMILANAILSGSGAGWGTMENAVQYLSTAAKYGKIEAITNLANCYTMGRGVEMDAAKGFALLLKASALGDDLATLNIAQMYFTGYGVEQDKVMGWVLTQGLVAKGMPQAKDFMAQIIKSGYIGPEMN